MKKQIKTDIFALGLLLMPCLLQAFVWYMETDTDVSIVMDNVDYLFVADGADKFSIVQKDGGLVAGVSSVTFTQRQPTHVNVSSDVELQLYPNPVVLYTF